MMWELEGRAGALAGTFKVQNVANTLWEACVFHPSGPCGKKSVDAGAQ